MISISKKIICFLGTCVFLIIFLHSNHANAAKCKKDQIFKDGRCQFDYGKYFDNAKKKNERKNFLKKIIGLNYLEKRKHCKEEANKADTVYIGDRKYKSCMKGE